MRTIRVSLWGQLKLLAQTDTVTLTLSEPCKIEDVIHNLGESFGALKALLIDDNGTCRRSILAFVNGTQWSWDAEDVLDEGADVTLMSPIAGG